MVQNLLDRFASDETKLDIERRLSEIEAGDFELGELAPDDIRTILFYTSDDSGAINQRIRENAATADDLQFIEHFTAAARKLPLLQAGQRLLRFITLDKAAIPGFLASHRIGEVVEFRHPVSCTTSARSSFEPLEPDAGGTIAVYSILNHQAHAVMAISLYPSELEVILLPGARIEVLDINVSGASIDVEARQCALAW